MGELEERVERQYKAYGHVLRSMGLGTNDMPDLADVRALMPPHVRAWLAERAAGGHEDDLVLVPSVRHLGGWQAFRAVIKAIEWASLSERASLNPYTYPFEPPERRIAARQQLVGRVDRMLGRPDRNAEKDKAEQARYAARHDDGQRADWLVGFLLDDSDRGEPAARGLKYTSLDLGGQLAAIRKEDEEKHRPYGRCIGSITIPQYFLWQGMRRHLGVPMADRQTREPFYNTGTTFALSWRTRFPYYPAGLYSVPTGDPQTAGRTDHYAVVGSASDGDNVAVYLGDQSDGPAYSEGVRRVLRLSYRFDRDALRPPPAR